MNTRQKHRQTSRRRSEYSIRYQIGRDLLELPPRIESLQEAMTRAQEHHKTYGLEVWVEDVKAKEPVYALPSEERAQAKGGGE